MKNYIVYTILRILVKEEDSVPFCVMTLFVSTFATNCALIIMALDLLQRVFKRKDLKTSF